MAGSSASSGSRVLFRWHRAQARVVLQIRAERPASVPGAVHDVTRPCQAAVPFSQTSDPGPWLRLAPPPPQTTREDEERPTTLRPRHAPFPGCPGRAGPAGAASLRSPPLQWRPLHWAAPNAPRLCSSSPRRSRTPFLQLDRRAACAPPRPGGRGVCGAAGRAGPPVSPLVSRPGPPEEAWPGCWTLGSLGGAQPPTPTPGRREALAARAESASPALHAAVPAPGAAAPRAPRKRLRTPAPRKVTERRLRPRGPPAPGNRTGSPGRPRTVSPRHRGGRWRCCASLAGGRALTDGHVTLPSLAHDAVAAWTQMERGGRAAPSSPAVS